VVLDFARSFDGILLDTFMIAQGLHISRDSHINPFILSS